MRTDFLEIQESPLVPRGTLRLAVGEKRVAPTRPVTASPINQMGCIPIHVFADAEKNRAPVCTFLFSSILPKRLNAEGREPEALCSAVLLAVAALDCSAADIVDQTNCKAAGVVGVQGTNGLSVLI